MSNRLFRLSELLAPKYGFKSIASDEDDIKAVNRIKDEIINAFNLYVNDETIPVPKIDPAISHYSAVNKDLIIPKLSGVNEPTSKYILMTMRKLMDSIRDLDSNALFVILGRLKDRMINDNINDVVNFAKENGGEVLVPKIRSTYKRLSGIINNQQKALQKYTTKTKEFEDKTYAPPVQPIDRRDLIKFMRMPYVSDIGLTNYGILEALLDEPGGRALITNVYNSLQRGHKPKQGNELWSAIIALKKLYSERKPKNTEYFETSTTSPSPLVPAFEGESFSEPSFRSPEQTEKKRKEEKDAIKGEGI